MFSKHFSSFKPVFPHSLREEQAQVHANSLEALLKNSSWGTRCGQEGESGIILTPPSARSHFPHPPFQMLTGVFSRWLPPLPSSLLGNFPPQIDKLQKDSQVLDTAGLPKNTCTKVKTSYN